MKTSYWQGYEDYWEGVHVNVFAENSESWKAYNNGWDDAQEHNPYTDWCESCKYYH